MSLKGSPGSKALGRPVWGKLEGGGATFDIIFDTVGKRSFSSRKRALTQNGIYLTTVPSLAIFFQMLWTSKIGSKKAMIA